MQGCWVSSPGPTCRAVSCTRDTTGTLLMLHLLSSTPKHQVLPTLLCFSNPSLLFTHCLLSLCSHLEATMNLSPPICATPLPLIPTLLRQWPCRSSNHHRRLQLQVCNEPSLISMTFKPLPTFPLHLSTNPFNELDCEQILNHPTSSTIPPVLPD